MCVCVCFCQMFLFFFFFSFAETGGEREGGGLHGADAGDVEDGAREGGAPVGCVCGDAGEEVDAGDGEEPAGDELLFLFSVRWEERRGGGYHEARAEEEDEAAGERVADERGDAQRDEEDGGVDRAVAVGLELQGEEVGACLPHGVGGGGEDEGEGEGAGFEEVRGEDGLGG